MMRDGQEAGKGSIEIYKSPNGKTELQVRLDHETVWLTQKQIADLFNTQRQAITKHIENVYGSRELERRATSSKMELVQNEGGRNIKRTVFQYNLDMIISVGYRVNSQSATCFRIWATKVLKDHLVKGFSVNDDRLVELQRQFESQKENYMNLRFFLNKFLGKVARKDVVDAVIERVDGLSRDITQIREIVAKIESRSRKN